MFLSVHFNNGKILQAEFPAQTLMTGHGDAIHLEWIDPQGMANKLSWDTEEANYAHWQGEPSEFEEFTRYNDKNREEDEKVGGTQGS